MIKSPVEAVTIQSKRLAVASQRKIRIEDPGERQTGKADIDPSRVDGERSAASLDEHERGGRHTGTGG
jgi:hypothetical protein